MNQDDWKAKLALIRDGFLSALGKTAVAGIAEFETHYLGRKGELTLLLRDLKDFPIEERKILGALGNALKAELSGALDARKTETGVGNVDLQKSQFDLTLSGYPFTKGGLHPITVTINKMYDGLQKLGFSIAEGPLIEEDYFNFEALNFAPDHPARDMQDTFYVDLKDAKGKDLLLRTHTSPVQIRSLKRQAPPLRIVSAGRVFRSEAVDASHSFAFHQMEGFCVDKSVTMADLKWTDRKSVV